MLTKSGLQQIPRVQLADNRDLSTTSPRETEEWDKSSARERSNEAPALNRRGSSVGIRGSGPLSPPALVVTATRIHHSQIPRAIRTRNLAPATFSFRGSFSFRRGDRVELGAKRAPTLVEQQTLAIPSARRLPPAGSRRLPTNKRQPSVHVVARAAFGRHRRQRKLREPMFRVSRRAVFCRTIGDAVYKNAILGSNNVFYSPIVAYNTILVALCILNALPKTRTAIENYIQTVSLNT